MSVLVITCEQFNVNDNTYKVLDSYYSNGDQVRRNDILFSLDSSKAVLDIESEGDGHFYSNVQVEQNVMVGQPLYIISKEPITDQLQIDKYLIFKEPVQEINNEISFSKIITRNAKKLLLDNNLKETDFNEEVITEDIVTKYLSSKIAPALLLEEANHNKIKRIAFIGAGQGLIQALDIVFKSGEFIPTVIYDDTVEKQDMEIFNIRVAGPVDFDAIINDYRNGKFDAIINTVSVSIDFRQTVFDKLNSSGVPFANLIHPTAYIGFNNKIGSGNIILTHVSIGPCTQIGNNNFISAHCNIEHHNKMGDHCTFGPGVMTSGNVTIGSKVKFGTGVFIEPKLNINDNIVVASGCVINRDIPENVVAYNHGVKLSFKTLNG